MSVKKSTATVALGTAAAIALAVPSTERWEGVWLTARVDTIGTGRPVTYCYGQTNEFGKVKIGEHFTLKQCEQMLLVSLPKYNAEISPCIHVPISDLTRASFIQTAYNTGSGALCRSSVFRKLNAGDYTGACEALEHFIVTSQHVVRRGLVARRKDASAMCLNGLEKPKPEPQTKLAWWRR